MKPEEAISLAKRIKKDSDAFLSPENRGKGAVAFIDLVGSTEFKVKNPAETAWLPRLATFLKVATDVVESNNGEVVKYIGDEVMAFFPSNYAVTEAAQAAEMLFVLLEEIEDYDLEAKIALDYGEVSFLEFTRGGQSNSGVKDPNGTTVDRAARISGQCKAKTVLCSEQFYAGLKAAGSWASIGKFTPKGFAEEIEVFQLSYDSSPRVELVDQSLSYEDSLSRIEELQVKLDAANALLTRGGK